MKKFITSTLLAVMALVSFGQNHLNPVAPPFLQAGDTIAIVSLGSTPKDGIAEGAAKVLQQWGFNTIIGKNVTAKHAMYAGTVEERLSDLLTALRNPKVKAILSTRGGYGSSLLLSELPLDTLRKYPKWIIGYSDITSMHSAQVCAGNMSLHANMGGALNEKGANDPVNIMLRDVLMGKYPDYTVPAHPLNHYGQADGILLGGNMSVFSLLSGSKYDFLMPHRWMRKPVILFFEDVGESIPRVTSMLTQLRLKGVLGHVRGIIVDRFTDYKPQNGYTDMNEMLSETLNRYNIPVCYDFPASHDESWNYPMIEGCPATLEVTPGGVTLQFGEQGQ